MINNTALKPIAELDVAAPVQELNEFARFDLPEKLIKSLTRIGFVKPTPIQEQTISLALKGKDILASAQTGTGKTGAFGIPLIAGLMNDPKATALIMTPTRELATQVLASLQSMIPVADIKTALLIGGESMPKQFGQLDRRPRLIVGTPGRINDHLLRGSLKLHDTKFVVLDETDRMLDMGFGVQIEKIMKYVSATRQMLLYSATLPKHIVKMADLYLKNPERISAGITSTPAPKIKQEVIETSADDKYDKLLIELSIREGTVIIFVKTKHGSDRLATRLIKDGHTADCIHGDLQQRRRDKVIHAYRDKKFRILVATDVAARGLDIPHIETVINYDLPQCPEDYIHRIGRTGRAGASGEAINFLCSADYDKWDAIQTLLTGKKPERRQGAPNSAKPKRRSGGRNVSGGRNSGSRNSNSRSSGDRNFGDRNSNANGSGGEGGGGRNFNSARPNSRADSRTGSSRSSASRDGAPRSDSRSDSRGGSRDGNRNAPRDGNRDGRPATAEKSKNKAFFQKRQTGRI
jgi:superfamily II DNA/RNA helicase